MQWHEFGSGDERVAVVWCDVGNAEIRFPVGTSGMFDIQGNKIDTTLVEFGEEPFYVFYGKDSKFGFVK